MNAWAVAYLMTTMHGGESWYTDAPFVCWIIHQAHKQVYVTNYESVTIFKEWKGQPKFVNTRKTTGSSGKSLENDCKQRRRSVENYIFLLLSICICKTKLNYVLISLVFHILLPSFLAYYVCISCFGFYIICGQKGIFVADSGEASTTPY